MSIADQENPSLACRMKSIPANPNLPALVSAGHLFCQFLRVQGSSASKGTGNGSLPAAQGLRESLTLNPQEQQCCQQTRARVLQELSIKTSPYFRSCFSLRSMSARIACTWQTQMRAGCDALTGVETGKRACRVKYSRATERPGAPWLGSAFREAFSTVSACKRQETRALSSPLHNSMRYPTRQPGWPRTG